MNTTTSPHALLEQTRPRLSPPAWRGLLAYALATFALSWGVAALLHVFWQSEKAPTALRMATVAASYALCMGWQPLVATWLARRWVDRVNLDDILQTAKPRFYGIATAAPLVLAGAAVLVLMTIGANTAPSQPGGPAASLGLRLLAMLSIAVGMSLIWVQALAEEVGWRGYFLPRLMEQCGPVTGLALHGVVWGIWYAPILLMANGPHPVSGISSGSFVVTCIFLGVLLGWLRLASGSVVPSTVANSVLTLAAGLPFIVDGAEPGIRAAIYGPAGWVPLCFAVLVVLLTRLRNQVRVPRIEVARTTTRILLVVLPNVVDTDDERVLH